MSPSGIIRWTVAAFVHKRSVLATWMWRRPAAPSHHEFRGFANRARNGRMAKTGSKRLGSRHGPCQRAKDLIQLAKFNVLKHNKNNFVVRKRKAPMIYR